MRNRSSPGTGASLADPSVLCMSHSTLNMHAAATAACMDCPGSERHLRRNGALRAWGDGRGAFVPVPSVLTFRGRGGRGSRGKHAAVALPPGSLFIADTATAPLRLLPESMLPAYLKPLRLQLRDKFVPLSKPVPHPSQ
jgi:hypothetical protein